MRHDFFLPFALCIAAGSTLSSAACAKKDGTRLADEAAAEANAVARAGAESSAVVSASVSSAGGAGTEWYRAGAGQDLKLTWAVYPVISDGEFGPERKLELVLRLGDAVRRVPLGVQRGNLAPRDQSVCNPSLKEGERVSQLKYDSIGRKAFYAKRTRPDLLEVSYFVDADPEERSVVATVPVPNDARITDAITDIRDAANETPFDCSKGSSTTPTGTLKLSPSAKAVDTTDWKAAQPGSTLALRWTADQSRATPPLPKNVDPGGDKAGASYSGDRAKVSVPLDLVLTLNGRSHSVSLQANAGVVGGSQCGKVSFFWAGLNVPFELTRVEGGKVVLMQTGRQIYAFDVPPRVNVTQELTVISASGGRTTKKDCQPATL